MGTKNNDALQPLANWEEVDVVFNPVANKDTIVPHTLAPLNPDAVNYIPIRKSQAADIYHDVSVTRKKWQQNYIVLRSTVANAKATLLLYVSRS